MSQENKVELAERMMREFADRTGVSKEDGSGDRYLWTDAFAVQSFWALYSHTSKEVYKEWAVRLISMVHNTLGKFRKDDPREGWISGLSEVEGGKHPTIGGLRIGKKMAERKSNEAYNARLEWERDGQYFHYITRWISALLTSYRETGELNYAQWAAELALISGKFMDTGVAKNRMYWKMSTDLSRPLVDSMGAHDPLEGAILCRLCKEVYPDLESDLQEVVKELDSICKGRNWGTSDPLGLGGLMIIVVRSNTLDQESLPSELQASYLAQSALKGLSDYERKYDPKQPAFQRLAFRECGLTLGFRVLSKLDKESQQLLSKMAPFENLITHLENFWTRKEHRASAAWLDHMDINAVTLASSLLARSKPDCFVSVN